MGTYLVTGANRGIGLELCRQLSLRGDTVIAACRHTTPELAELGVTVHEGVDVSSDESVEQLSSDLAHVELDVIVNNAGVMVGDSLDSVDMENVRHQLEVNTLGPLRVAMKLRRSLVQGGKFAIVTSLMGSIEDNGSGGYYGYRMSKAAVNAVGMSLANDLKGEQIAVCLLHPGMVATDMTGGRGISVEESAVGLLKRIAESSLENSGSFRHQDGSDLPW